MDARHVGGHGRGITMLGKEKLMKEATELVQRYLAVWNESDPEERLAAIRTLWADGGAYVDPLAEVAGHDQISALVGAVQQQLPGHVFRLLDGVDAHHNVARFWWELVPGDGGESVAEGFDVATTEGDGRIRSVVGFLDKVPAG
jgi:SnoaL-like domain